MGLTWKDAVTTAFIGAIAVVYAAFLGGTSAWLISSARGATLAVFVLGGAFVAHRHEVTNSRPAARQ